ncbi:ATPase ARSA1-like isoform X1 [Brassica rapa]|uniref:ATPase ARSA1-like isoform X1 n=2 Tax=Brassica campestris TaxID=3711 RepID=UPI0004F1CA22|nr:ATPase ARSA1-like isoform X1 [Brassica rapa]XP_033135151.1 ATPase ARSA1-like isoform X1 [Brassica rapa]XP_033135152.1 ATPase ARSA1-like isoform X1 [Brassica rapa]XP_033135153.1 ATPase ARSA1-like isoform X1 [Brassica rapa]
MLHHLVFDEISVISKVLQFMESPEYNRFTHIVLDTAPTGHTLRLLSLSNFYDSSIGKITKLKKKITAAASAFTSVFGKKEIQQQGPSNELDQLKERMEKVLNVFREVDTTEFVVVTIATFSYLFIRSLVYMWLLRRLALFFYPIKDKFE